MVDLLERGGVRDARGMEGYFRGVEGLGWLEVWESIKWRFAFRSKLKS